MKKLKNETGRSMVEMLGVLAIIGVLSVGGIAGYTSAMRQYRANEIVNATSMLYMMGASQNQGAGDKQMLYSAALGTVPSGVSEITYNADKTITLAFTDTDVCPLVKNKLGDKASGDCSGTSSTLTVTLGETTSATEDPEPIGGESCEVAGQKRCNYTEKILYQCVDGIWQGLDSCAQCSKNQFKCLSGQIIKCNEGLWGQPETDTEGKCVTGIGGTTHYRCEMGSIFLYDNTDPDWDTDVLGSCDCHGADGWFDSPEEFASNCSSL